MKTNPLLRKIRYLFRNPFQDKHGHLLVFCCHHKVGTSWFKNILMAISAEFGLPFVRDDQAEIRDPRSIFFQYHSQVDVASLPEYRGAHIIRDPRDLVVSGYYYHLWTKEEWAITPIQDLPVDMEKLWMLLPVKEIRHLSYQQYLQSLPREEGIMAEIRRASTADLREIFEWDYGNPKFFEFKYEAIMQHEEDVLRQLFHHYDFRDEAVERAVEIARRFSFERRTQRKTGVVDNKSHLRSGKLQQWKTEFNEEHKAYFKSLHGERLIKLGYEVDLAW